MTHLEPVGGQKPMPSPSSPHVLRLGFVGDIALGKAIWPEIDRHPAEWLFAEVADELAALDHVVGNFEGFAVAPSEEQDVSMGIRTKDVARLAPHFDAVTLANNHSMDGGRRGLQLSQEALSGAEIDYFGAGLDRGKAERPLISTVKGWRIAHLGACDKSAQEAGPARAGTPAFDAARLLSRVEAVKPNADLICVSLHADFEFRDLPNPDRISIAHRLIDAGAHLVIQHHPHVPQGWECHNGGVIAYSLGNFVFNMVSNGYMRDHARCWESVLFRVDVSGSKDAPQLDAHWVPLRIDQGGRPVRPSDAEAADQMITVQRISAMLDRPEVLRKAWRETAQWQSKRWRNDIYWALRAGRFGDAVRQAYIVLSRRENRRCVKGALGL